MSAQATEAATRHRVLMLAFHFPPQKGSSGSQRTLGFCRHLPAFGWDPLVLTAHPRAYPNVSRSEGDAAIPPVHVERAFALDAARHFALGGYYPSRLAVPDRWATWLPGAVRRGLRMIAALRPQLLWSTSPIPTAHAAALKLHRATGIPWIADLRDPMTEPGYPADPALFRAVRRIERDTVRHASRVVLVTPGAERMYRERYPEVDPAAWACIENGYEESDFAQAAPPPPAAVDASPVRLLHSGTIYPRERDPAALLAALAQLRADGEIAPEGFELLLRAPGNDAELSRQVSALGLDGIVKLGAPAPYREALREMLAADGLLVLQGPTCNSQIPAKAYEYLRAGRPIVALADPAGDTATLLRACGVQFLAHIERIEEIRTELRAFLDAVRTRRAAAPDAGKVALLTRRARASQLASLFDRTLGG